MKQSILWISCLIITLVSCQTKNEKELPALAQEVKNETMRTWQAYKQYAWGHDALQPLTKSYRDWYEKSLYISPIDAYSTLHLMGFYEETKEIEDYIIDSLDFDKDINAKIFEVNIRILGGLLAIYDLTKKPEILSKTVDFADRMMPAFNSGTGIPHYWVNLKTGKPSGDTVNVAEAGTYLLEMGLLSYYTKNPKYYKAAKKATKAIFERRSEIGLIGDVIDVENGLWVSEQSHICAGVDSYYEYLYKAWVLFGDPELKEMWDISIIGINQYLAENYDNKLWYGRSNMHTGELESAVITLYDAFFPAILILSGDKERAIRLQHSWDWLWNKYGLEPMVYDYKTELPNYPVYDLNPEIIESAYYIYHFTGDTTFLNMNKGYWSDLQKYCRTDVAYTSVLDVRTMEQKDYMPTFFLAETLKYFYLTFAGDAIEFDFDDHIFNTEAHQYKRSNINQEKAKEFLGFSKETNIIN